MKVEASVQPNGYLFFQMPKSEQFGIVLKAFWEEHHHLSDDCFLANTDIILRNFSEPMESFLKHRDSYQEGLGELRKLGFEEIENPYPELDDEEDED